MLSRRFADSRAGVVLRKQVRRSAVISRLQSSRVSQVSNQIGNLRYEDLRQPADV